MAKSNIPTIEFIINNIGDLVYSLTNEIAIYDKISAMHIDFFKQKTNGAKSVLDVQIWIRHILEKIYKTKQLPVDMPVDTYKAEMILSILANMLRCEIRIYEFPDDKLLLTGKLTKVKPLTENFTLKCYVIPDPGDFEFEEKAAFDPDIDWGSSEDELPPSKKIKLTALKPDQSPSIELSPTDSDTIKPTETQEFLTHLQDSNVKQKLALQSKLLKKINKVFNCIETLPVNENCTLACLSCCTQNLLISKKRKKQEKH